MNVFILIIASILSIFWLYVHFRFRNQFQAEINGIQASEYPLSDIYYIGFGFMRIIRFDLESKGAKKKIQELSEIYGKRYASFYYYVLTGAKFTFVLTLSTIVLLLIALAQDTSVLFLGIILVGAMVWYLDERVNDKITFRRDEILRQYPQMLSKLTVLVNAGLPVREAWRKIAGANQGILYDEMRVMVDELSNGVQEIDAIKAFGERCALKPIRKFSIMMIQNIQKGSFEVIQFLSEMSKEAWEEKKHIARRKGEVASSKLIFPIGMIFLGVLAVIMVPIFSSFRF